MNNKEREKFWKVLLAAKNESDVEKLLSVIKYPNKLYRYRQLKDIKDIKALEENKLYFSTSNYYDDPFDTFIRIDTKQVKNIGKCIEKGNIPPAMVSSFNLIPKQNLSKENINITLKNVISFAKDTRNEIRKHTWSLCFTERHDNENLWLKYANNHKGFVLEYNINDLGNAIFDTEKPASCMINNNIRFSLYPMYYSRRKNGYNATDYAGFIACCRFLENLNLINLIQIFILLTDLNLFFKIILPI